jgi:putative DNA primase/helicase
MTTTTKKATHTQIADTFSARHASDTMFTRGGWYRYLGGVWAEMHELEINHEIWNLLREFENQDQIRPSDSVHRSVKNCIKAAMYVPVEQIDGFTTLTNLTNGIFNHDDGNLYPANPDYYFTTQLPFEYDPTSPAHYWMMYLQSTFVKPRSRDTDPELIEFVQEAMGYSLTTDISHHCTFWCHGSGANGKGVLFHVLEQLGGSAVVPLNVGLLKREQYQLAMLAGKRMALCSEASASNSLVEDALIKALIAGDSLNVRMIHRDPFILHPTVKLWWSMNDLPAVADTSDGFWRRVRVIPFNRQFSMNEQILDLKDKLSLELPGIFNWCMAGLRRLRSRGKFSLPNQVDVSTAAYRKDSNPVQLFIDSECTVDPNYWESSSLLYSSYKSWCFDNGFKHKSSQRFKIEMEKLGHFYDRDRGGRRYLYLKLSSGSMYQPIMP